MHSRDLFSDYHPLVNILYFALVLGCSMFLLHPFCLLVSLLCALSYSLRLNGRAAVARSMGYLLPTALLATLVNAAFNHEGATVLTYLPSGNPLTLESILYGLAAAVMLAGVLLWFSCCTAVLTTDKFVYLFGRVIPALSLVLSMTLRFVPRFAAQFRAVAEGQRCLGRDLSRGPLLQRLRVAVTVFSILVTWALENAVDTADSMKSRGYGLPGRTAFSLYRLDGRDRAAFSWLICAGSFLLWGAFSGGLRWSYYPVSDGGPFTPLTALLHLCHLALCMTPMILNWKEDRAWKHFKSGT